MVDKVDFMVAAGLNGASYYTPINKFGYNTAVNNSYESITDLGTFNLPSTAAAVSVVSSSAQDGPAGTGARTIEVEGLDENYVEQVATITMAGTGAATTGSTTFIRVFRMRVLTTGSNETNVGNITASVGGDDVAQISADNGQTLMSVYTVPANKVAYLIKFQASISKNQEATIQLRTKGHNDNGVWQVKGQFGTFASVVGYNYAVPLMIPAKTDIEFRAKAGATSEIGVVFDLVLNG